MNFRWEIPTLTQGSSPDSMMEIYWACTGDSGKEGSQLLSTLQGRRTQEESGSVALLLGEVPKEK